MKEEFIIRFNKKSFFLKIGLIFIVSLIVYYGYSNLNNKTINLTWKRYTNHYFTVEYPSEWIIKEKNNYLEFVTRSSVPFVDDKFKFSVKTIKENASEKEFEEFMSNYLKKNDLEKTKKNVEKITINEVINYKIERNMNAKKNKIINFYTYKDGLIFNSKLKSQAGRYIKDLEIANKMIKSYEFSRDSYKVITDIIEKEWNQYTLGKLEVYYPDNSVIADEIEEWTKIRIKAFNYITDYLKTEWNYEPIKMYVFNNNKQGKKYGLKPNFASVSSRKIFTRYNQTPGHELTHIISCNMNNLKFIKSLLIIEGLATYLNMTNKDYHRIASIVLYKNDYKIKLLGEKFMKIKKVIILIF